MAPAVVGEFGAFYSASILAVTANPIYELASLCLPHGTDPLRRTRSSFR